MCFAGLVSFSKVNYLWMARIERMFYKHESFCIILLTALEPPCICIGKKLDRKIYTNSSDLFIPPAMSASCYQLLERHEL